MTKPTIEDVRKALDGIDVMWLTFNHPEYGIECTMVRSGPGEHSDDDATVINQPDAISAILEARKALDAGTHQMQETE